MKKIIMAVAAVMGLASGASALGLSIDYAGCSAQHNAHVIDLEAPQCVASRLAFRQQAGALIAQAAHRVSWQADADGQQWGSVTYDSGLILTFTRSGNRITSVVIEGNATDYIEVSLYLDAVGSVRSVSIVDVDGFESRRTDVWDVRVAHRVVDSAVLGAGGR